MSASRFNIHSTLLVCSALEDYFWFSGSRSAKLKSSVPNESPWLKPACKKKILKIY